MLLYDGEGLKIFEGTNFLFRILYFLTAMMPAYILLDIQLYLKKNINIYFFGIILIVIFMVSIFMVWFIKFLMTNRYNEDKSAEVEKLINERSQISSRNNGAVTFLVGIILPSIIIFENSVAYTLIVFTLLQLVLLVLMLKSHSVFFNVPMIMMGIDVYQLHEGSFILTINGKLRLSREKIKLVRIGDSEMCHTYIYKKGQE